MSDASVPLLQCSRCQFRTTMFGEFMNHPCQQRQLQQQQQVERRIKRIRLDHYLFCPVCGCCRRKADEEDRRAGKLHVGDVKDHCLLCWTHYDQDWSFLEKIFVLPWGYSIDLCCPHDDCALIVMRSGLRLSGCQDDENANNPFPGSSAKSCIAPAISATGKRNRISCCPFPRTGSGS